MRNRANGIREIPETDRYWCVDLGKPKGKHHFKLPVYSVMSRAFEYLYGTSFTSDNLNMMSNALETHALTVGLSWFNRGKDLESELPRTRSDEELAAFIESVQDEMLDAGYTVRDLKALGAVCTSRFTDWIREMNEAQTQADFTEPPEATGEV